MFPHHLIEAFPVLCIACSSAKQQTAYRIESGMNKWIKIYDKILPTARKQTAQTPGADPGFLERGFIYSVYKGVGVGDCVAYFISFFLNIP